MFSRTILKIYFIKSINKYLWTSYFIYVNIVNTD